jgi:hypothetical protein
VGSEIDTQIDDRDDRILRSYLYWTPNDRIAISAAVDLEKFEQAEKDGVGLPIEVDTISVPVLARYFDPSGVFAEAGLRYVDQSVTAALSTAPSNIIERQTRADNFLLVDAAVGYRLPRRRGIISVSVSNILDENFLFQDDAFRNAEQPSPRFLPSRQIMLRASVNF